MKRLTANVTGLVQGVSYRYYARREAKTLGVTGWIRNEANGSVQVVAEGKKEVLEALVQFLFRGSPMARVADVALEWSAATGEFASFEVRFA